jgi:hypothetical protein
MSAANSSPHLWLTDDEFFSAKRSIRLRDRVACAGGGGTLLDSPRDRSDQIVSQAAVCERSHRHASTPVSAPVR